MKNLSKRSLLLLSLTLCLFAQRVSAQVTFTSWVHPPSITLYAADTSAGITTSSSISADDIYSDTLAIGFSFNYFGVAYSKCLIGANGNICFDISKAAGYNDWVISTPLLSSLSTYNTICGPWCDMDIFYTGSNIGEVTYFSYGTAPNRLFAANFCHNSMYSCSGQYTTSQIILYESTNVIEMHIAHKDICTAWNGGYAIVGVHSDSATATAVTAPGRDYPATWTAANEAWRFTPSGSTYTVSSIPYANIPYYTVYWYDSATNVYLGSGDSIVLTPTAPTTYKAVAVNCIDTGTTGVDSAGTGYMYLLPITGTGIGPLTANQKLSIYPNPAYNELNIAADQLITDITITDLLGQTVINQQNNSRHAVININALPPGIYLVKVNGTMMRKFVKE